jgi:hypothetical protein
MAILEDKRTALRKAVLPTAAGAIGAGAGLFLTRKRTLRDSMPNLNDLGIGDLADDLRRKLDSVLAKADLSSRTGSSSDSRGSRQLDPAEFEKRRREREQRRSRRRARS